MKTQSPVAVYTANIISLINLSCYFCIGFMGNKTLQMYLNANQKMNQLPPDYQELKISSLREQFLKSEKTIVMFDDDLTGTQPCYNVTVLTSWRVRLNYKD